MLKIRLKNNNQNAVWLVEPKVTLGRAPSNDLVVNDPSVADFHAEIHVDHEQLTLHCIAKDTEVTVNRCAVNEPMPVHTGDVLVLGGVELEVIDPKLEQRPQVKQQKALTEWALKALQTGLKNSHFPLKPVTVVGRAKECDISLAMAHLSRRHAQLVVKDNALYVKDLDSANGTYLNGKRIKQSRVQRGDELRFDTLTFGVIGPAEDLDKTTIRPAVSLVKNPPKREKKAPLRATSPRRVSQVPVRAEATADSSGPAPEAARSSGVKWAVTILLGLGMAAAYWAHYNGLLSLYS